MLTEAERAGIVVYLLFWEFSRFAFWYNKVTCRDRKKEIKIIIKNSVFLNVLTSIFKMGVCVICLGGGGYLFCVINLCPCAL